MINILVMNKINLHKQAFPFSMSWRQKLKDLRLEKGLTQEKLADYLGMSYSNYGKIENGGVGLDIDKAIKLARLYNISMNELFSDEYPNLGKSASQPIVAEAKEKYRDRPIRLLLEVNPNHSDTDLPEFLANLQEMIAKYNTKAPNSPENDK